MELLAFFTHLFDRSDFLARWECGGFNNLPLTGWLMVLSDLAIFGAYLTIPFLLLYFVSKRKDMVFPRVFWLFAAFIFACGVSHLLDAVMFWWPMYRFNVLERLATAAISWVTVMALIPIIPQALSLKSPQTLEREIKERELAEQRLLELNNNLEHIIEARTRDLETQKRKLEAANRELEAFSYSVSHDLKAPLRKISQFGEILRERYEQELEPSAQDYLGRIQKNSQHMYELIEDLLSFSKVNRTELERQQVDLAEIARQFEKDFRESEPERQVVFKIEDGLQAQGDANLVYLVMQNLLTNSWKYTSPREKAVIEIGKMLQGSQTVFFVRDNGIGFDMKKAQERLFAPFFRMHHEFPGSGIGLASVQRIIHRHQGKVWAESAPDQGATFYFTLPEKA